MAHKQGDLLKVLLERQKKNSQAPPVTDLPAPRTEPKPAPPIPFATPRKKARWRLPAIPLPRTSLLVGGGLVLLILVLSSFLIGQFFADRANSPPSVSSPPQVAGFAWGEGFTVEAVSKELGDHALIFRLKDHLSLYGLSGMAVSHEGKARIFVGRADDAGSSSLVQLRDWLRELPGPDGKETPFQSASIRKIPKVDLPGR